MPPDIFYSYFSGSDLIVSDRQIYNIVYGKDTRDFLLFRGARFGLLPGPHLDDLEKSFWLQEPACLGEIICSTLEQKISSIGNNFDVNKYTDPSSIRRAVFYDLSRRFSFRNVLKPEKRKRRIFSAAEAVSDLKKRIAKSIESRILSGAIGTDMMIIGGRIYRAEQTESEYTAKGIFAKVGNKRIVANSQNEKGVNAIIEEYVRLLKSAVLDRVAPEEVRRLAQMGTDLEFERISGLDESFDPGSNIGFAENSSGFFLFTITPEYVLWEHKKNKYFRFPSAKVGVKLSLDNSCRANVSNPLVMNSYKHPALGQLDKEYSSMCFQYFDSSFVDDLPSSEKAFQLLFEGCRMLMVNYHSEGVAFKNLDDERYADVFRDLKVEKPGDDAEITNRRTCLRCL